MHKGLGETIRRPLATVAAVMAVLLVGLTVAPAQAAVTRSDYLPKSVVKATMGGTGTWYRAVGERNWAPLGADPAACRSDLPLSRARETRSAFFWGPKPASPTYYGQVQVTIAQFSTKKKAKRGMRKIARWVPACPTVVEWSCTDCDGIAEYERTPAKPRTVGTQSYAWREKSIGMGVSNGRAIATRRGRIIVIVVAAHQTDPVNMTMPPPPRWRQAVKLARQSLNRATA